jgi:hypothetical protein
VVAPEANAHAAMSMVHALIGLSAETADADPSPLLGVIRHASRQLQLSKLGLQGFDQSLATTVKALSQLDGLGPTQQLLPPALVAWSEAPEPAQNLVPPPALFELFRAS